MRKVLVVFSLILVVFSGGCSGLLKVQKKGPVLSSPQEDISQDVTLKERQSSEKRGQKDIADAPETVPEGLIFAKTDFQGIVKTSYVQLAIRDRVDDSKVYQLYIGDKTNQQTFPWNTKTVNPGYFFIKLPVGSYHINSISIPVSTTTATEPMDITFEVKLDKAVYLGTLRVLGTKEKIKLGGVPVLKPGFEYSVELVDERQTALEKFHQYFPDFKDDIEVDLMQVNRKSNIENFETNP